MKYVSVLALMVGSYFLGMSQEIRKDTEDWRKEQIKIAELKKDMYSAIETAKINCIGGIK